MQSSEEHINHELQMMREVKASFRNFSGKQYAFEQVLQNYYDNLRNAKSSTTEFITSSLNALQSALNHPQLIKHELLVNFISEIIKFVENVGLGYEFGEAFIDRAIEVYRNADLSLVDLYLAKAKYLRLNKLENQVRENTLMDAKSYVETVSNKDGMMRVLIALAEYYTEVSYYNKSLQMCRKAEELINGDKRLRTYYSQVLTMFGINYNTMFNIKLAEIYLLRAKHLLDEEMTKEVMQDDIILNRRTMASILHYLGRNEEVKGNLQMAMNYYIQSYRYLQMCPEELSETAFYHLRLGEILAAAGLLHQASEHIRVSHDIFDKIQYSSSGRVQVSLAWASIYSKQGDYQRARKYIIEAKKEAVEKNFCRGELWCLIRLFWLECNYLQIHHAIFVFFQALKTWHTGELKRSGGLRLFRNYILQIMATPFKILLHLPHRVLGASAFNTSIKTCICPVHSSIT